MIEIAGADGIDGLIVYPYDFPGIRDLPVHILESKPLTLNLGVMLHKYEGYSAGVKTTTQVILRPGPLILFFKEPESATGISEIDRLDQTFARAGFSWKQRDIAKPAASRDEAKCQLQDFGFNSDILDTVYPENGLTPSIPQSKEVIFPFKYFPATEVHVVDTANIRLMLGLEGFEDISALVLILRNGSIVDRLSETPYKGRYSWARLNSETHFDIDGVKRRLRRLSFDPAVLDNIVPVK